MLQPFVLFLLLPSLLLLLIANSIRKSAAARPNGIKLPPSPPKLPIIGNLHQLGGGGSLSPRSLRALSDRYGSPTGLMFLQLGCVPTIVVSSPEMAREILKTQDPVFAGRPPSKMSSLLSYGNTHSALSPYGEGWRQARKLGVAHLLCSKMVQSFQQIREEEVGLMATEITHRMSSADSVNMSDILVNFVGYIISRVVLGPLFREERHRIHALLEILKETNYLLAAFHLGDFFPVIGSLDILGLDVMAKRVAKRMDDFLEEVLEHYSGDNNRMMILEDDHKAAHEPTNLANVLLSLEKGCSSGSPVLTRGNVKTLLLDMLAAGTDTTSFVLERSMAELVRNPKVMEKLQGEVRRVAGCNKAMVREEDLGRMMFLKAVIKEVLRLHPPGEIFFPRESMEDCQLGGYDIPKETRVIIDAWAIGRDPRYWEDAEEFNPERFMNSSTDYMGNDFRFIPFGGGRRSCTGMNFALQNIEIALANLVYKFDWELPPADTQNDAPADRVEERLNLVAKLVA